MREDLAKGSADNDSSHPSKNDWMRTDPSVPTDAAARFAPARHNEMRSEDRRDAPAPTVLSAHIQRLARELDLDPEELAKRIDPDTVRRTKYPVRAVPQDDGTMRFENSPVVREGRRNG